MNAPIPGIALRTRIGEAPDFRVILPNDAENVALVRHALGGVAEVLGLPHERLIDINAAVSEACNNVVLHAYDGDAGPLEVYVCPDGDELEIVVHDEGTGIMPGPPRPELELQGVGLSLIQALTDRVEFHGGAAEGTEVRMAFTLDHTIEMPDAAARQREREVHPPPGEYSVAVAAGPMAGPVLSRVSAVLGARAGFSLEAISEAQLVTDAIAAHAARAIVGRHIHVGFEVGSGSIVVRVGPLDEGGARLMLDSSGVGGMPPVLERLPNEVAVEEHPDGELLRLTLAGGR
jgi:anti-sigma regulatory factor (Ser/Thr protein kinase)